ncbi:hypothetical protein R0131_01655 [Clostridium sp. AL.422]|uniref:hypothetical protein n=1 Tax=Clostridium TaxID=1485 RepID=UPI00293DA817|nr:MULTISPECIES: hypothetical protein [unclassified Clostridium]MDV4149534.1 hypothetical protein [Clostridium sp. AL.422]
MKTLKVFFSLILIFIFTINIGCSKVNGKDTQSIKAPNNENLIISGTWKIEDINIIDDEIENKDEILSQKNSLISISKNKISIFNKSYQNPSFKLKVVDGSYVLSYELDLKLKDIIESSNKLDIISVIDSNKLVGEFIVIDDNNGYLFYSGLLLKLVREDINPIEVENYSRNQIEAEVLEEDYNSDVGVMIALKTPRIKMEDGSFSEASYRTLWISFKDDKLEPVLEKNNIIFPRLNGIWTIENKVSNTENVHNEYFIAKPIDSREDSQLVREKTINLYKDINFISNDYISIERFEGDYFNNVFPMYITIPIDNINSFEGLSIEEIYSNEVKQKYERDFNEEYDSLTSELKSTLNKEVDYTNFTIKRIEGKWTLVGKISSQNSNEEGLDFKLSINPSKKILNYDTLLIPWKDLKGSFPFIEDAYTSPTGRVAIIIFNNKLFVYELEGRSIKGNPLMSMDLNEGESVIMSEWASGSYVDTWARAFKEGRVINMEEE